MELREIESFRLYLEQRAVQLRGSTNYRFRWVASKVEQLMKDIGLAASGQANADIEQFRISELTERQRKLEREIQDIQTEKTKLTGAAHGR